MKKFDKLCESSFDQILEADDSAGRGRGIIPIGQGAKRAIGGATTSLSVDFFNRPPPRAKFDAMNYYTLDVRLTPPIAVKLMQSNVATYEKTAQEAITKFIIDSKASLAEPPDTPPNLSKQTLTGKDANEIRVKAVIKDAFNASMQKLGKSVQQSKLRTQLGDTTPTPINDSVDVFDVIIDTILFEDSTPADIELSKDFISKNNLKVGDKIKYTTNSGKTMDVIIRGLPGDKTTSGKIPPNSMQVSKVDNNTLFAANIVKNGQVMVNQTPTPQTSNELSTTWKPEWDKKSLDELKGVPELKYIIDELPSFFISGKPQTVCIVSIGGFVAAISNALESAFRGSIKNGVTLEELVGGKFSKKLVNPEVGAFINKIQDQTSGKAVDFRAWNEDDLETLHNIIMWTFSDSDLLKSISTAKEEEQSAKEKGAQTGQEQPAPTGTAPTGTTTTTQGTTQFNPESVDKFDSLCDMLLLEVGPIAPLAPAGTPQSTQPTPAETDTQADTNAPAAQPQANNANKAPAGTPKTLKGLVLYMTQEDFNKFVKGGQGFKNLATGLAKDISSQMNTFNL